VCRTRTKPFYYYHYIIITLLLRPRVCFRLIISRVSKCLNLYEYYRYYFYHSFPSVFDFILNFPLFLRVVSAAFQKTLAVIVWFFVSCYCRACGLVFCFFFYPPLFINLLHCIINVLKFHPTYYRLLVFSDFFLTSCSVLLWTTWSHNN
jgi:hypothetical protein